MRLLHLVALAGLLALAGLVTADDLYSKAVTGYDNCLGASPCPDHTGSCGDGSAATCIAFYANGGTAYYNWTDPGDVGTLCGAHLQHLCVRTIYVTVGNPDGTNCRFRFWWNDGGGNRDTTCGTGSYQRLGAATIKDCIGAQKFYLENIDTSNHVYFKQTVEMGTASVDNTQARC